MREICPLPRVTQSDQARTVLRRTTTESVSNAIPARPHVDGSGAAAVAVVNSTRKPVGLSLLLGPSALCTIKSSVFTPLWNPLVMEKGDQPVKSPPVCAVETP